MAKCKSQTNVFHILLKHGRLFQHARKTATHLLNVNGLNWYMSGSRVSPITCITYRNQFVNIERDIGEWWKREMEQVMVNAGKEEKWLAEKRGDF